MGIKRIEKKLESLGFIKQFESDLEVHYIKKLSASTGDIQRVDIYSNPNGLHLLFSYMQEDSEFENEAIGLTETEMKWFLKKFRWMRRYYHWADGIFRNSTIGLDISRN